LSPTETRGLQLLGPGGASAETGEHARDALVPLGTGSMRRVVEDLAGTGRNVIFDLPPLSAEETVLEAAAAIGSLVLVARSGHTRRDDLKQLAAMLRERNIEIRVVLLTDVPADLLAGRPAFEEAGKRWSRRMTPSTRDESLEPVVRVDG
jgi:Mrp family chromosome partitioning ATPase